MEVIYDNKYKNPKVEDLFMSEAFTQGKNQQIKKDASRRENQTFF
jgi:hypothetical protein